jgi:hypothetical protein
MIAFTSNSHRKTISKNIRKERRGGVGSVKKIMTAVLTMIAGLAIGGEAVADTYFPNKPATGRVTYKNGCTAAPIWIAWQVTTASVSENTKKPAVYQHLDMPPATMLEPGASVTHQIPDAGLIGYRAWPAFNCKPNAAGKTPADGWFDCQIGGSGGLSQKDGPAPGCSAPGCAPAIDSLFEGTFGCRLKDKSKCIPNPSAAADSNGNRPRINNQDFVDSSNVDGWTLPYTVKIDTKNCAKAPANKTIDCSGLLLSACTTEDLSAVDASLTKVDLTAKHPTTGALAGCYSPCSKLSSSNWGNTNYAGSSKTGPATIPFCCPEGTPKAECAAAVGKTNYVKTVPTMCTPSYTWAYDDSQGLLQCDVETSSYTVTFNCPEEAL